MSTDLLIQVQDKNWKATTRRMEIECITSKAAAAKIRKEN